MPNVAESSSATTGQQSWRVAHWLSFRSCPVSTGSVDRDYDQHRQAENPGFWMQIDTMPSDCSKIKISGQALKGMGAVCALLNINTYSRGSKVTVDR
jgi:hypothetical protein